MIFTKDSIEVHAVGELGGLRFREGSPKPEEKTCLVDPSLSVAEIDRILEANKLFIHDFKYDVLSLCHGSIAGHNVAFVHPSLIWTDRISSIKLAVFPSDKLRPILSESEDIEALMAKINRSLIRKFLLIDPETANTCNNTWDLIHYVSENILAARLCLPQHVLPASRNFPPLRMENHSVGCAS